MEKSIAQRTYELLEPLPANEWITEDFTDREHKCCAIGHISRLKSADPSNYKKGNCVLRTGADSLADNLWDTTKKYIKSQDSLYVDIVDINDGKSNMYTEPDPKARVMHLLTDMINAGY